MKRNPTLKTPWAGHGLLHSPGDRKSVNGEIVYPDVKEWRDNEPFNVTIKMRGTERGRSAAFFRWEVLDGDLPEGTALPMFITDVGHVLMHGMAQPGGVVKGEFFVVKRGQNYGITPAQPAEDTAPRGQERPTETTGAPSGP
jgi:hypothetical protein